MRKLFSLYSTTWKRIVLVAIFSVFSSAALAQSSLPGLSDTLVHPPSAVGLFDYNVFLLPLTPGVSYVDPVFGTTVLRLTTDHVDDDIYATNMKWNADETRYLHRTTNGTPWPDYWEVIDAATGTTTHTGIPNGAAISAGDGGFDPADPNALYYYGADGIHEVTLNADGTWSDAVYFTPPGGEALKPLGSTINWFDASGRYMLVRYGPEPSVYLYDRQNMAAGPYGNPINGTSYIDSGSYIGITPDGQFLVGYQSGAGIGFGGMGQGVSWKIDHTNRVVATSPNIFWFLCGDHGSFISPSDGRDYMIVNDCYTNAGLWRVDITNNANGLNEAQQQALPNNKLLLAYPTWNDFGHYTTVARGLLQDWAFASTEDSTDTFNNGTADINGNITPWHAYRQEIIAVNVVTGQIQRLAHHRSRSVGSNYYNQPRVSASWGGKYVGFASDFNQNGVVDIYAVPFSVTSNSTTTTSTTTPTTTSTTTTSPIITPTTSTTTTTRQTTTTSTTTTTTTTRQTITTSTTTTTIITTVSNSSPSANTLTPPNITTAPGVAQSFTATYSDPNGFQTLSDISFYIAGTQNQWVHYSPATNSFTLIGANGSCTPGQAATLSTNFLTLNCNGSTASGSGTTLTATYSLTPQPSFTGQRTLLILATDQAGASNGKIAGTWTVNAPVNNSGLAGYWAFNEGTGTTATDSSGNGNTGTLLNGPVWTTGKIGTALAFNGLGAYVSGPHNNALNGYPLTVAAWIKTATTGLNGIVNKYYASSMNGYQLFMNGGNICAWYFKNASNYIWDGSGCTLMTPGYADNQWHHVVFVVDANGGRLYVDGFQKATQAWNGTPGSTSSTQPLSIGQYPGTASPYFSGLIDEVRLYNSALSTAQVFSLYSSPLLEGVIWTNLVNTTATGNSLKKTSGCDGCEDAGAVSQQQITSGNSYVEFTASETSTLRFIGLSNGNPGTTAAEIKFAIRLQAGYAEVRESGTYKINTLFATGDVFRVAVESGVVNYYKNGSLFYTSMTPPSYPLLVDTALLNLNATITNANILH